MQDIETNANASTRLTAKMRQALEKGHMDRFNTLHRQRNHLLLWLAGTLPDRPHIRGLSSTPPDHETLRRIFEGALNENRAMIRFARRGMDSTKTKIEALARRRESQSRLAQGYQGHYTGTSLIKI